MSRDLLPALPAKPLPKTLRRWRARWRRLVGATTVDLRPGSLPVNRRAWSEAIVEQVYLDAYEAAERRAVARLLREGDRVLELGTAVGAVALAILAARPAASLHLEPNPDLVVDARRTFAANGLSPDLRQAAAVPSTHAGDTVTLHLGADFWAGATSAREVHARAVEVPAIPLPRLVADFRPTVIVADVEGAECDLFAEGDLPGVRAICLELHRRITGPEAQRRMLAHLLSIGFVPDFAASRGEIVVLGRADGAAEG